MWNRREISVSSSDDPSHYLHPHPYARQAEPQWALPCVLPSPEELGPILLPRRAGSDGRSQEVAVLERAMQRLLSNRVEDFVRQWPLVQRSLRTCVTHIMVTLVYYIYVERFGLAGGGRSVVRGTCAATMAWMALLELHRALSRCGSASRLNLCTQLTAQPVLGRRAGRACLGEVPPPRHQHSDPNTDLTEIYLPFQIPT
jgi:hypothetical protein